MADVLDRRVCGRVFSGGDLELIRAIIADASVPCRCEIARRTCEALKWRAPSGRLKVMSCRLALLRLEAQGLLKLPAPRPTNFQRKLDRGSEVLIAEPSKRIECSVEALAEVLIRPVRNRCDSRVWNEAISQFHYLGYKPLPGAQMRYLVTSGEEILAALGFGASAWKVAARDRFIGWSKEQREERLPLVVNNARFLILPWVRSPNLASYVLSRCARRIPADWQHRYGYKPVLLETFVERDRFRGSCYRAANWTYVGDTEGRGKLDRMHLRALPIKQIHVYPLRPDFRQVLCA